LLLVSAGPKKDFAVKAVSLLLMVLNLAVIILSVATVFVSLLSPRIPPFFGYFLCQLAHDINAFGDPCLIRNDLDIRMVLLSFRLSDVQNLFRILSSCICFAIYIPGILSVNLMAIYEVLISLIFQKDCLNRFHAGITHAKFSNYEMTMRKYKQLQLLNINFNGLYQREFFATFMATILLIMIPSGYILLTSYRLNHIVLILLGFITFMEYLIITGIFIMASKVWNASVKFKCAWRKNASLSSCPLSRRQAASLQNLKIKMGSYNFVETNTPLVFLSFCVEQTIALVLLKNY
jgi:hypothetical protein